MFKPDLHIFSTNLTHGPIHQYDIFRETTSQIPGNISVASNPGPRNYIQEKGNQLDLFFRVFPKIKLIFAWSSRRTIIGAILGPIHQGQRVYLQTGALHAWVVASDEVALVS